MQREHPVRSRIRRHTLGTHMNLAVGIANDAALLEDRGRLANFCRCD